MQLSRKNPDFPYVTTILRQTQPSNAIVGLHSWRKRIGNREANRILASSCHRRQLLDKLLKEYAHNHCVSCTNELIKPYWDSLHAVLQQVSDIRAVEQVVINHKERYQARPDWIARYKGLPYVIEFTSSTKPKLDNYLTDKYLQVVANGGAINRYYGTKLFGCKVQRALIIIALPNQKAQVIVLNRDQIITYWHQWQKRLNLYYQKL